MNRFWQDAVSIFETARNAPPEGGNCELNILIDDAGGLRIVTEAGWRPEALAAHFGASTVYQVTHTADGVRVAGRSLSARCVLEAAMPVRAPHGTMNRLGPVCR